MDNVLKFSNFLSQKSTNLLVEFKNSCNLKWPSRRNILIWIFGFFIMLIFTARDFQKLLDQYKNNNVQAKMEIQRKPISPNVTICLPYYGVEFYSFIPNLIKLEKKFLNGSDEMKEAWPYSNEMKNQSWDFWNQMEDKEWREETWDVAVTKFFLDKFLKDGLNITDIEVAERDWKQIIFDAAWNYFGWIYKDDIRVLTTDDYSYPTDKNFNYSPNQTNHLFDLIKNVTQLTITGGCTERKEGDFVNSTLLTQLRLPSFTVVGDKFCFQPNKQLEAKNYVCTYNRWPYNWNRFMDSLFELYPNPAILYSQVAEKDALYITDNSKLGGENESEYVHLFYNTDQNLIASDDNKNCSNEQTEEVCIARGQAEAAKQYCNCIPFTFRYLLHSTNYEYCTRKFYSKCQERLKKSLNELRQNCNNKCEYTSFSFSTSSPWSHGPILNRFQYSATNPHFLVSVTSSKKPHIEFSNEIKNSSEQFLSQIGGLLNFYLGVSGLTLVALLILFIDQTERWYNLKNLQNQGNNQNRVGAWNFLRIVSIFHMLGGMRKNDSKDTDDETNEMRTKIEGLEREIAEMKQIINEICQQIKKPTNDMVDKKE